MLGTAVVGSCLLGNVVPSYAGDNASGTRVNSDAESLLRYGLPIKNKEIRDIQGSIESSKLNLKTRRLLFAKTDINKAAGQLKEKREKLLAAVPEANKEKAISALDKILADIVPLQEAMSAETDAGAGSLQQREALDRAYSQQDVVAKDLSCFEELLVPIGYQRKVPDEYKNIPRLVGRAEVAMTFTRPGTEPFNVDGVNYNSLDMKLVIDGYNAPVTGGNFVDLVKKGFYNNKKIDRADGFVVQMGDNDPEGTVHGYVPAGSSEERKVPLEIAIKGDPELLYGATSEDDMRGSAATVLPFQSTGALGMAREEYVFILLYYCSPLLFLFVMSLSLLSTYCSLLASLA
jgi:cyclophilin family peptidyl-prolyl cis-trans isomerase